MSQGRELETTKELIDEAVKRALEVNSKSGIMFILRERTFREIIEAVAPIISEPYIQRIAELEAQLDGRVVPGQEHAPASTEQPPKKTQDPGLLRLRESLEDMVELTKSQDK